MSNLKDTNNLRGNYNDDIEVSSEIETISQEKEIEEVANDANQGGSNKGEKEKEIDQAHNSVQENDTTLDDSNKEEKGQSKINGQQENDDDAQTTTDVNETKQIDPTRLDVNITPISEYETNAQLQKGEENTLKSTEIQDTTQEYANREETKDQVVNTNDNITVVGQSEVNCQQENDDDAQTTYTTVVNKTKQIDETDNDDTAASTESESMGKDEEVNILITKEVEKKQGGQVRMDGNSYNITVARESGPIRLMEVDDTLNTNETKDTMEKDQFQLNCNTNDSTRQTIWTSNYVVAAVIVAGIAVVVLTKAYFSTFLQTFAVCIALYICARLLENSARRDDKILPECQAKKSDLHFAQETDDSSNGLSQEFCHQMHETEDSLPSDKSRFEDNCKNNNDATLEYGTIGQENKDNMKKNKDMVRHCIEEVNLNTDDNKDAQMCNSEKECVQELFLERFNLKQYYPNKLKLMDVMAVKDCTNPLEMNTIALHIAMKLIMINYTARDELPLQLTQRLQEENDTPSNESSFDNLFGYDGDDDDEIEIKDLKSINPLDLLLTIFKCSSPMLQQVLAGKLFKCKLAIPLLTPSVDKEPDLLTLWPLRSIMIECKTENGSLDFMSVDCPCHVVSFLRLGRPSVSKSKLMNEIISDQYHNTFFNKDCSLGTSKRVVSEGMVETGWYLPSKNAPHFHNVTMFFNLRGDGKAFKTRSHNVSLLSNVIVILLHINELSEDPSNEFIQSLLLTDSKICLAVDAGIYKRQEIRKKLELFFQKIKDMEHQPKPIIIAMNGQMKSISTVKTELRKTISDLASDSDLKTTALLERVKKYKGNVDEEKEIYVTTEHAAREVMGHIKSLETNVKREVVPLQGKTWQTWSEKMKKSNKASLYKTLQEQGKLKNDMLEERRKQAEMCNKLSPAMSLFLGYLQQFVSCNDHCLVFILFLKQMLDERSRKILPGYLADFLICWQELKLARDKNEHSNVIKNLREKLNISEQCLAEASFGFEHFCREMGQIYESLKDFPPQQNEQLQKLNHFLPYLTVHLLLLGQPFEIMDGDVANVPLDWVTVVFKTLKETIGDKRLLTLSVLGIQSSGKSTLLNTMFGLQFAVSAGRCTRGVFMQLVPVSREKSLYDYILVIDTEGLRAPELALQKHSHDNELATFVIGLGDITIMNIKGENTAEMKDVLQIAVHASLRLKLANERLNLKQSCVFIHQNVPAFDANDKMMQGRQKFVEELDMMTKEAADQENIADIQSFSQVIEFDSEKNVWYFSDLWRGDPPMAPANPGYSDSVAEVKESIVAKIAATRSTYLTITDTISRISDLWNGIVKDDFVFSFRNSLDMKAYTSLEQMCQDVSWKLEKYVLEFGQTKARSKLVVCKSQTELETAVSQLVIDLRKEVNIKVENQKHELEAFIDQNSLKDVMIQWVQNKKFKLTDNADILIKNAERNFNYVKDEILVKCKTTEEKTKHEMEINEQAKSLAIQMKGQKPKEEELQKQFNELWNTWIKKFPSTQDIDVPIDMQIESTLCEKFQSDAAFIMKHKPLADQSYYHNLKKLEGSLNEKHIHPKRHLSINKWLFGKFGKDEKTEVCVRQTVDVMNTIFRQIDNIMQNLSTQDIQFDIAYVTEILTLVVIGIECHNKHENNDYKFNLLPSFRAMMINHVVSYAKEFFTKKNRDYNRKHSPKAQMEEYKGTAWILFQSTVQNKADDVIAVGLFKEAIHKALVEHMDNLIPIDVSDYIFKYFGNGKHGLITEILIELATDEHFDNYFKFIEDPYTYAEKWLMQFIEKKLFGTITNRQTVYANLVQTRSCNRFDEIQNCINSSTKSSNANISDWIKTFVSDANDFGKLPLSEGMFVHVQNIPVKDIQAFVDLINEEMVGSRKDFLIPYKETTWSTIQWKETPITRIMKILWGCTELCMFCHEPCKEMSPDHWERDNQPHTCVQHRPDGLKGFRYSRTSKMSVDFCNFSVGSDLTYKIGEKRGPYKEYKNHFPSWDIKPNANASDYWKWVACTFKENFMSKYDMEAPDIPENWRFITKQKAIDSLSTLS